MRSALSGFSLTCLEWQGLSRLQGWAASWSLHGGRTSGWFLWIFPTLPMWSWLSIPPWRTPLLLGWTQKKVWSSFWKTSDPLVEFLTRVSGPSHEGKVYWSDSTMKKISRASISGKAQEDIVSTGEEGDSRVLIFSSSHSILTPFWLHLPPCRLDDDRWPGGRCRGQEDLLDRYWNQPHWGCKPGWFHEENSGLAEPGQPPSHRPLQWDGVSLTFF